MLRTHSVRQASRRFYLQSLLLTALIGSTVGGRASADPLLLTVLSQGAGADVTITFAAPTPDYPNGFTLNGFAGIMSLQIGNNPGFIGFCVDLAHFDYVGQTFLVNPSSTDSPSNGLTNGGQVAYLANTYGGLALSNVLAAGLQIAIWSELYNNGTGFTSGVFQYTAGENAGDPNYSAIAAAATGFLNDAQGNSSVATWYDGSPSGAGQWRGQNMVDPAVPAPPSLVLFLLGLSGLGIAPRWRKRLVLA